MPDFQRRLRSSHHASGNPTIGKTPGSGTASVRTSIRTHSGAEPLATTSTGRWITGSAAGAVTATGSGGSGLLSAPRSAHAATDGDAASKPMARNFILKSPNKMRVIWFVFKNNQEI